MVNDCEGVDASKNEVLRNFVGERFHGYEEDVGVADFLLRLYAPEADLAIVEGDFICESGQKMVMAGCEKDVVPALMPSGAGIVASIASAIGA